MAKAKSQASNTPGGAGPARPSASRSASTPVTTRGAGRRRWLPNRESINQPGTFIIVATVVVLVVGGLVAYGYWDSYIKPAHQAAVTVGGRSYDLKYFARRFRGELTDPSAQSLTPQQIGELPNKIAVDIIEEEVLLQRASSLGVSVTDDEIDQKTAEKLVIPFTRNDDGTIQSTPSLTNAVRNALQRSGLTVAEFRRETHAQALKDAVRKYFDALTPKEGPGYRIRQIVVADEARAKEVKQALDGGADFSDLAGSNTNVDQLTKSRGGLRDFTPQGILPKEFEDVIANLALGQVSEPFKSGNRWVILRVEERAEAKEYTDQERSLMASTAVANWLQAQRDELSARSFMDDKDRVSWVVKESGALDIAAQRAANPRSAPGGGMPINIPTGGSP